MSLIRKILRYIAVFVVCVIFLTGILAASTLIPGTALKDNMLSSAGVVCEKRVFFELWKGTSSSKIDRYADSILLNIAYHFDSNDPLRSVMISEYYCNEFKNENDNLMDSLTDDLPANTEYMRYWHGLTVPIRVMHLFTDINGMYITSGVIIAVLTVLLAAVLIKHRIYAGAAGIVLGLLSVGIWFVPFSLEYAPVFVIMLAMSIAAVPLTLHQKTDALLILFLICGIVTNYFDFFTCETVTVTVPLLLTVFIRRRFLSATAKENAFFSLRACVLWGAGYVGMWFTKWVMAAAVTGEDFAPQITEHITERIGETHDESIFTYIFGNIPRNFGCLFPGGLGGFGIVAAAVIALVAGYICFVYRKKGADWHTILLYAAVGAVPYLRYLVILNHSYLHFFFTYRAQISALLALCLIIAEVTGAGRPANAVKKRKRA